MDARCAHCPVTTGVCPAITLGHARYCELVDPTHPDHDPAYNQVLRDKAANATPGGDAPGAAIATRRPCGRCGSKR
jgi:hypothetical protein